MTLLQMTIHPQNFFNPQKNFNPQKFLTLTTILTLKYKKILIRNKYKQNYFSLFLWYLFTRDKRRASICTIVTVESFIFFDRLGRDLELETRDSQQETRNPHQ